MARNKISSPIDLKHLPAVIKSVKTPVGFAALCVVILAVGALALGAWMNGENQRLLIISVMAIVALLVVGIFTLAFFRPVALDGSGEDPAGEDRNSIQSCALNEALRSAFERNPRINVLRVFALTSGQITPLLYELVDSVHLGELRMILFDNSSSALPEDLRSKIKQNYEGVTHYLEQIRAKVKRLEVKFQPFCPTEYAIIVDNHELILGWFRYDRTSFTGFRAERPIVLRGRGSQADIVRHKADLFDTWFNSL
jgi:hypothetical protein